MTNRNINTSTDGFTVLRPPRRQFLAGAGALALTSAVATPFVARASSDPFKLGVLLPFSGGLELFGEQGLQGIRMAVDEMNADGGVLGRQIEIVQADDRTDPRTAVERATQLIRRDEVNAIVGPVTSANRDAIKSTIERGETPLLYATDYEGGVCSDWIACYSPLPAHYVEPLIPFLAESGSSSYYLFGADYIWPQLMNRAIQAVVEESGGSVAEEEYSPFGVRDFAPTIRKIEESGADTVILTLPGADGVTFVKQLHAAGLRDQVRIAFLGFNENYLPGFDDSEVEGIIAPVPFHQRLDRPEARDFVARQRAANGDDAVVSYYAESHYGITSFYLDAVRSADSDDRAAVMAALPDQTKTFGNGEVTLRASDKHVDLNMIIAEVQDGAIETHTYIGQVDAPDQCTV
ncbi:MAG: ABC-type high affinity urea uptake system substrate-binding component UrtA [Rhodobacteraceae bacterium HLUCCA12]|nr:MAG: ABC-type high affinity urea uptake system substrate-binding component UrtA [Rhodobacteraceae bacterium HLUCCA12]